MSRGNSLLNAQMGSVLLFRVDQIGTKRCDGVGGVHIRTLLGSFGDKRAEKILAFFLTGFWRLLNANSSYLRACISETDRHGSWRTSVKR